MSLQAVKFILISLFPVSLGLHLIEDIKIYRFFTYRELFQTNV